MSGIRFIPSQTGVGSRVGIGLSAVVGPTGAMGPTGSAGLQGPAGVASMTGASGLQGFQGLVGATGAGFQGLVGPTGPSNPGVQGLVGATGATGLQGLQGLVGATGASGLQGLFGSTGSIGPQGGAGMGFVVFANTTSYTGLNTVIATGGNVGQFVLVLGGDLFVYAGTGSGYTGPDNSYGYAGDVTDESKLVGTQGFQGFMGSTGSIGLQGPAGSVSFSGSLDSLTVTGTSYLNDTISSGNMSGANAYFVNLAGENLAAQGASIGFNGLTVVGGTTLIGSLQATGGLSAPTATINNLIVTGSITLPTGASAGPQGPQGLIGVQGSQYTGPFTQLTVSGASSLNTVTVSGYMTGTSGFFSSLKVTDLVVGGETGGSLYINTGVVSNLTVMNQIITGNLTLATGATIGSVGDTLFTDASLNVANVFTVNAYNGDVISTGTFIAATGIFSNLTSTTTTVTGTSYLNNVVASGNMSGANAYFQNLAGQNLAAQGATLGFSGLSVVGGTTLIGSLNATGGITTTTLTAASANLASLTVPSLSVTSILATSGTITNLTSTNLSSTNSTSTTSTVTGTSYLNNVVASGNMSGANAYFVNLAGENIASQGTQVGFNGLLVVGETTLIGSLNATGGLTTTTLSATSETVGTSTITSLTATTATINTLSAPVLSSTTGSITNLTSTNATLTSATIPTLSSTTATINTLTAPILSSTTGSITNLSSSVLTATNATIASATIPNLNVTNLVVGSETGGSLYINTGVVSNLTVMNQIITGQLTLATGATIGSAGDTIFTDASFNVANVFTVNAYNWDVMATGSLRASSGSFGKLKVDSELNLATGAIVTGNLTLATGSSIGSSSDTLFTDASLNVANVFTVNAYNGDVISTGTFISSSGSFNKLNASTATVSGTSYLNNVVASGNMSGANAYFVNLAGQNFAAQGISAGFSGLLVVGGTTLIGSLNATGGITTTTLSASSETVGTSNISSLTATSASIPTLSSTTGTITNLTSTNLNATTATVSGTTYLNNTISSGNMSGANGYFLNLAGQNLASQGASIGFSGLSVVGTSSLIGALYATGGINSQGITTTNLTVNNNLILQYTGASATGSIESNTLRGNCTIENPNTSLTVTNSLVSSLSSVFAIASTADATGYVTSVVPSSGSFVINCIAPTLPMNINWLVIN
jgi:hypothetical protein